MAFYQLRAYFFPTIIGSVAHFQLNHDYWRAWEYLVAGPSNPKVPIKTFHPLSLQENPQLSRPLKGQKCRYKA